MKIRLGLILFLFSALQTVEAQKILSSESKVLFEIDGVAWTTVEGSITGMSGNVLFDPNNLALSYFKVCVKPSTVKTGIEKRDKHLLTADFFNVGVYPNICFKSNTIVKTSKGYSTTGNLKMLKTTKKVEVPFTLRKEGNKTILTGEITLNRFDYELAAESYESTMMVDDEVRITIICVLQ
jgi:polyisoprenoid-binding protein YceI